jgi:hypothetical protein
VCDNEREWRFDDAFNTKYEVSKLEPCKGVQI